MLKTERKPIKQGDAVIEKSLKALQLAFIQKYGASDQHDSARRPFKQDLNLGKASG
ncbi:hypothetical protein ACI2KR_26965 [Pseudomonas luteola]